MRRIAINLFALLVIGVGGSYLSGVEAAQAASCSGPPGSNGCVCTSGDGKYTCQGDTCTSDWTSCTARDLKPNIGVDIGSEFESSIDKEIGTQN